MPDGRYERNDYQLLDPFNSNINPNINNGGHGNDSIDNINSKLHDSFGNLDACDLDVDLMLRPLLPAQGALFITNYRIIFTGVPKDPFRKFFFKMLTNLTSEIVVNKGKILKKKY